MVRNLPINIKHIIIIFPAKLKFDVIPKVRPTVPKAETTSKKTSIKLALYIDAKSEESNSSLKNVSESNSATRAIITIKILILITTIALLIAFVEIFLLNTLISCLP